MLPYQTEILNNFKPFPGPPHVSTIQINSFH